MPGIQLDHIAIATHRLTDVPPLLVGVLGGIPFFGHQAPAFRFGQWEFEGEGRIEVLYSDYRPLDGRQVPHREVLRVDGEEILTISVKSFEVNPEVDVASFQKPAA